MTALRALRAPLLLGLLHLCALLPLAAARALARAVAAVYWPLNRRSRRITERNLALAFPDWSAPARQALARESLAATAELAAEMGLVWLRAWPQLARHICRVEGAERVAQALAQGRGVVVLGPHLGNWEVLGLHLATLGPLVTLYEPPQLAALDLLVRRARERSGARLVPTDPRGLAALVRALRAGQITGILPDQVPPDVRAGRNVPFMGLSCFTATLAIQLIQRSGAEALFGYAERVPGGFVVRYERAEPAVSDPDPDVALAALNRGVEACLRRCPAQYQWEYRRFRERPARGPGHYAGL